MKVLVLGAGQVGFHLAKRLSEENQDVVLIESDPERAEFASQQLDVLTVVGNGASLPVLEEAGIKDASMLLSVTSKDEVNLIACMAAKRLGVQFAVARISNPEYYGQGSVLSQEQMGIDLMINPERECARETFDLLRSEIATDVVPFADGRVQLVGLRINDGAPVVGKSMAELTDSLHGHHYATVAIVRDGKTRIPRADSQIEAGDQLYILSPTAEIQDIAPLAGYKHSELRRVMIAGGSREGAYLAEILQEHGIECTILDRDRRRCLELAEQLPRALVLHGDATDLELLEMEGVAGIDGFVDGRRSEGGEPRSQVRVSEARTESRCRRFSLAANVDRQRHPAVCAARTGRDGRRTDGHGRRGHRIRGGRGLHDRGKNLEGGPLPQGRRDRDDHSRR
jgi:trk system potassium uptake protein TrkA